MLTCESEPVSSTFVHHLQVRTRTVLQFILLFASQLKYLSLVVKSTLHWSTEVIDTGINFTYSR